MVASYETDIIRYMHYYGFGIFEPLLWRYLRWLFNHCHHTYVPSQVTKDQLIKGGIRDVRVFERGVDSVRFHPRKRSEAVRKSLGVEPGGALVLYAGRLSKEKSLDVLLRAFIRLAGEHPQARLVVTGDGPHRRALQSVPLVCRRVTRPDCGGRFFPLPGVSHSRFAPADSGRHGRPSTWSTSKRSLKCSAFLRVFARVCCCRLPTRRAPTSRPLRAPTSTRSCTSTAGNR